MNRKRTRNACARCRRQKLKCDKQRPCPLCVRANVECKDATEHARSNRAHLQGTRSRSPPRRPRLALNHQPSDQPTRRSGSGAPAERLNPAQQPCLGSSNPSSEVEPERPETSRVRDNRSALSLVKRIFGKYHHAGSTGPQHIDAIPEGLSPSIATPTVDHEEHVPVAELVGAPLPPMEVTEVLLRSYLNSTHWYLKLFHEPSLRARLEPILRTGLARPRQRPAVMLCFILLVIGARFMRPEDKERSCTGVDLVRLETRMLEVAQKGFLSSLEHPTVETIAFSFLLACNYLFSRQPSLSAITMEATLKAAQSMAMHQESTWGPMDGVQRQVHRRVWWAVFTGAGYVAMTHGKPSQIIESECDVGLPDDLDDDLVPSTEIGSLERRDDGQVKPITLHSYIRYRTKIYMVAASISRDVCLTRSCSAPYLITRTAQNHQRLLRWERMIPTELKVETYAGRNFHEPGPPHVRIFAMQAAALQMAYDNIQLFLFRPFLSDKLPSLPLNISDSSCLATPMSGPGSNIRPARNLENMTAIGMEQCFTSAVRTSSVGTSQFLPILALMRDSPINVHLGVHAFAAGVILSLLTLQNPLSDTGQACKRGIVRLIQAPRAAGLSAPVWTQAAAVLTDLMHVIALEEVNALVAGQVESAAAAEASARMRSFGAPPDWYGADDGDLANPEGRVCGQDRAGTGEGSPSQPRPDDDGDAMHADKQYETVITAGEGDLGISHGLELSQEFTLENLQDFSQAWVLDDMFNFV